MISPDAQLRQFQDETYFRLRSDTLFAPVAGFRDRVGEIDEEQIRLALGALNEGDTGKVGACFIVKMPRIVDAEPNLPGPCYELAQTVRILVMPLVNDDPATGTLLKEDVLALSVLHILHQASLGGDCQGCLFPDPNEALEPVVNFLEQGIQALDVTVRGRFGLTGNRVMNPQISGNAAAVTMTCATSDAAIYYTTDGSYPGSGNPEATLYSEPFAVTPGTTVRASAQRPDLNASHVNETIISA